MLSAPGQRGVGLIEVLIALVMISFALLGLAALQGKAQRAELESYQRSQALILLQDMASRLRANPAQRQNYVTDGAICNEESPPDSSAALHERDLHEWACLLAGHRERLSDEPVGGLIRGHGCIERIDDDLFVISVAWQGLTRVPRPNPEVSTCGQSSVPDAEEEERRRTLSIPVRFYVP
ncbi:MAG: type IV pilus modification protein PilV [Gammaproteobacteria bacterium]|nr:type IV pilus modification protein PilV [Gammaproteobacteria bacterium]